MSIEDECPTCCGNGAAPLGEPCLNCGGTGVMVLLSAAEKADMSGQETRGGCGEAIDAGATVPGPWAAAVSDVLAAARAVVKDGSGCFVGERGEYLAVDDEAFERLREALARLDGLR